MTREGYRGRWRRQAEELTDDERVRAALTHELPVDCLSESESEIFYDVEPFMGPSPEAVESLRQLRRRGGGVGCDSQGRLVKGLRGGKVVVLQKPQKK